MRNNTTTTIRQRIVNGIIAQSVCDAVGDKFEFELDINQEAVINWANKTTTLEITDDTQMAIFGFEAVFNIEKYQGSLIQKARSSFTKQYVNWYQAQSSAQHQVENRSSTEKLLEFPSLYKIKAPGNTCLSACNSLLQRQPVVNDSYGCGSVMRLLPLVFFENLYFEYANTDDIALMTGDLTHKHKKNAPAINSYMGTAAHIISSTDAKRTTVYNSNISHISELGQGWTAQECVEMGVWAFWKARDFDELLQLSIAHDGDSDSVAAIAGSLWGLAGYHVPEKYVTKLDNLDIIKYISMKINQPEF